MPLTPVHYPLAKLIHSIDTKNQLSLPALIVGSMVPDLEVPFLFWLTSTWTQDRMVLHSLLGGLTLGLAITIAFTVLIYPRAVGRLLPVNKDRLKSNCRITGWLAVSAVIGVLSHILLDVANHPFNPLFWPFLGMFQTPSPIVPLLGGLFTASIVTHGAMVILFVALFIRKRRGFWDSLFVG